MSKPLLEGISEGFEVIIIEVAVPVQRQRRRRMA
jgi:hypothetical protein